MELPGASQETLLTIADVSKRFGATQALKSVTFSVSSGEIVALLGENGAGKSTLIKLLAGVFRADTGQAVLAGVDLFAHVHAAPIAFIHQDLGLIEWMTVAENICLSLGYPRRFGMIDWHAAERRALDALALLGVEIEPGARVQTLDRTEKSLVAIARALAADARLIVLDEPTASLPGDDVLRLFVALRKLRETGVAMIFVSHRLDEVFELADRMVVMRDGRMVADRMVAETTPEEAILLIVGQEPTQLFARASARAGAPRLVLRDFSAGRLSPVSAEFYQGEVVGLVGLRGAGQECVGRGLFGLEGPWSGEVLLDGAPLAISSPKDAIAQGVLLVYGDRLSGSVVPGMTVRENLFLNPGAEGTKPWHYISPKDEEARAKAYGDALHLRPNNPDAPIEALSGGNQQKVVVGRWLHLRGRVYMFEDPTAGVDVGAKAEIYRLFNEVVAQGACILVISTDFEEIANICDRALIFDRQRIVAELSGDALSTSALIAASSAGLLPAA